MIARLKNFLFGFLLDLQIKEGLVECAKVCDKSEVILCHKCTVVGYSTRTAFLSPSSPRDLFDMSV